ncbi:unnamed protein product [Ostreobium quekettii]|uniref:Uncharacterized protein n=1 Tax=Ostreobium quekettii TaxID=121088 RepID=A0A8S1IZC8_9CHLO|nr:unnamed protein product [Ostreobium quekettii]|eukprot:evm.model.scf_587.2 EVM.evm.TU.scf_587.2   scf_587:40305-42840(+)
MDADIVLNELFSDGAELCVEYSDGPVAYRARWEGRPKTPPFKWGNDGEEVPAHDAWLAELDLRLEGLEALVSPELVKKDESHGETDLAAVKSLLVQYAGGLQAAFLYYECDGQKPPDTMGRMIMTQFRALMQASKAVTPKFTPEKVDEIFTTVATGSRSLERKVDATGASTFDLIDFFLAIVHTAYHRYACESGEDMASYSPLSSKLQTLMSDCFSARVFPELSKKMEKFKEAFTTGTDMLLKKGRRLTEHTLASCQLKRVKSVEVRVGLKYLCNHLARWNLLGREFSLQDLAYFTIAAKQQSDNPEEFELQPQPLDLNANEFERLLLFMAHYMYRMKKKHEPFEEFLGETLDEVYKKSNVLVDMNKLEDNL